MEIAKTPNITANVIPFIYKGEKHYALSAIAYFSFFTGEKIAASDALPLIAECVPGAVIDEGMPKMCGEYTVEILHSSKDFTSFIAEISFGELRKRIVGVGGDKSPTPKYYDAGSGVIGGIGSAFSDLLTDVRYIPPTDKLRSGFAGNTPGRTAYELPDDFSFEYFQTAVLDQRLPKNKFWEPGTPWSISVMAPEDPLRYGDKIDYSLSGNVPNFFMKMFCIADSKGQTLMIPGDLKLDTLRYFVECGVCCAVFHCIIPESLGKPLIFGIADASQLTSVKADGKMDLPVDQALFDWALAIHMANNEKKQREAPPVEEIKERIQLVRKETKAMRRRRYADIYAEYRDLAVGLGSSLVPRGDRRDYVTADDANKLKIAAETIEKNLNKNDVNRAGGNPFAALLNNELLPDEKNFSQRISSLIWHLDEQKTLDELEHRDPEMLIPARFYLQYLVRYIDKPIECEYKDWGVDKPGSFAIPSGMLVPCIKGDKFVAATVFPNGPFSSDGAFVIPGSSPDNFPFWHNGQETQGAPHIVCDDIWDAMLLATEMNHLASIECLPSPDAPMPDWLSALAKKTGAIVPCAETKIAETKKIWETQSPFILAVPAAFGFDDAGKVYSCLRDRLAGELSTFEWLNEYMPFDCYEPEHLPVQLVDAAISLKLKDNLGVDPFDPDGDLKAIDKAVDAEKEKLMKHLLRKSDRDRASAVIENSRAEAKIIARESPMPLMKRQVATQKEQIDAMKSILTDEQISDMKSKVEAAGKQFEIDFKAADDVQKRAAAALAELGTNAKAPLDDKIINSNIFREDLEELRRRGHFAIHGASAYDVDWADIDLSGFSFTDCSFSRIKMTGAKLSGASFASCVFSECQFEACASMYLKAQECDFLACSWFHQRFENSQWIDCSFKRCRLKELSFFKSSLKNCVLSVTQASECEFADSESEAMNIEFSEIVGFAFRQSRTDKLSCSDSKISRLSFEQSGGDRITIDSCSVMASDFSKTSFESFWAFDSEFADVSVANAHLKSATFDGLKWPFAMLDASVIDSLYAENCDLSESSMRFLSAKKCTMKTCNLKHTDLFHANLFCADLTGSLLGGASFEEANLFSADFTDAKIGNNKFSRSLLGCTLIERMETTL